MKKTQNCSNCGRTIQFYKMWLVLQFVRFPFFQIQNQMISQKRERERERECDIPISTQKKKKSRSNIFWVPTCQAPPNPTTHLTITLSFHSFGQLTPSVFFSFFFFFFIFGRTFSSLLQTLHRHFYTTTITISTIIFPTRSSENSQEPINTFTSFLRQKFLILLVGFALLLEVIFI